MLTVRDLNPEDFDSPQAYAHFVEAIAAYQPAEQDRMCRVVGKPSQFVGRVTSLATALEHWKQWEQWDRDDRARQQAARKESANGSSPKASAPSAPKQAVNEELETANREWREAIEWARKNTVEWDDFIRTQMENLREQARAAKEAREKMVKDKRDAFRAIKNRN